MVSYSNVISVVWPMPYTLFGSLWGNWFLMLASPQQGQSWIQVRCVAFGRLAHVPWFPYFHIYRDIKKYWQSMSITSSWPTRKSPQPILLGRPAKLDVVAGNGPRVGAAKHLCRLPGLKKKLWIPRICPANMLDLKHTHGDWRNCGWSSY